MLTGSLLSGIHIYNIGSNRGHFTYHSFQKIGHIICRAQCKMEICGPFQNLLIMWHRKETRTSASFWGPVPLDRLHAHKTSLVFQKMLFTICLSSCWLKKFSLVIMFNFLNRQSTLTISLNQATEAKGWASVVSQQPTMYCSIQLTLREGRKEDTGEASTMFPAQEIFKWLLFHSSYQVGELERLGLARGRRFEIMSWFLNNFKRLRWKHFPRVKLCQNSRSFKPGPYPAPAGKSLGQGGRRLPDVGLASRKGEAAHKALRGSARRGRGRGQWGAEPMKGGAEEKWLGS